MSKTIYFSSSQELSTEQNLNNFIEMAKNELTIFGSDLEFDDNIWEITKHIAGKQNTKNSLIFSNFKYSQNNKKEKNSIIPMREPFLSFAKAYIRYKQGINPIKSFTPILAVLRILESSFEELTIDINPTEINMDILTRASQITKEYYTIAVAYRYGQKLEEIGKFLNDKRISKIPIDWKNPISRPNDTQRVGKNADERRNKKMPSSMALEILPKIFFNATDSKEMFITSIIALLFGAPNRISEVFLLPINCEVKQNDVHGNEQYGLRWYPAKGADPMIKWIIPSMVDTIKLAISRIKKITKEARIVAKWYENNPKKLYLPKKLEYLRNKEYLDNNEVALIVYGKTSSYISSWLKTHKVKYEISSIKEIGGYKVPPKKNIIVKFTEIEKAIISLLPSNFPLVDIDKKFKYSETLIIQNINQFHNKKSKLIPTIKGLNIGFINDALGSRKGVSSIFNKYGYKENDGTRIKVSTHQFRHYLNTLAQKGGASQLDIAKWSGRKDIDQNLAYDHVTVDEMLEMVQDAIGSKDKLIGPLSNIDDIKKKVIISRDEFAILKANTAHLTDYGICFHDFSMMPCQIHRDCLNCTELACIKGDKITNENIRNRRNDVEKLVLHAKKAQDNGQIGSNRWVVHHMRELKVLTELCDIFDNDNVSNGSIIQISNISENAQIKQDSILNKSDINIDENEIINLLNKIGDN
jgi:hypothetical protein